MGNTPAKIVVHSHWYTREHVGLQNKINGLILRPEAVKHEALFPILRWEKLLDSSLTYQSVVAASRSSSYTIDEQLSSRFTWESDNSPVTENPEITFGKMAFPCPTVWVDLMSLCGCCHVTTMSALNLFGELINWSCCCGSAPRRIELRDASDGLS
jgi:hypothetical protein